MKMRGVLLLTGLLLLNVSHLAAQEFKSRTGLGVSLGKEILLPDQGLLASMLDFPHFTVPMRVSPQFLFEPEIGLYRHAMSYKDYGETYKTAVTVISLGCGIFKVRQEAQVHLYGGIRLGIMGIISSESYGREDHDDSRTDFSIGPAAGGEYLFSEHLSLGGEVQLNYIFIGQWNHGSDVSEAMIRTKPLIFLRWYF